MKILTWNVLHRIHAENYDDPAVGRWPDEVARTRHVVALISGAMRAGTIDVALLQELSGDTLAALRSELQNYSVISHVYPRVPRPRRARSALIAPEEHLVVVGPTGARRLHSETFGTDPGKGLLAVEVALGVSVATTHVSFGASSQAQLARLSQLAQEIPSVCCVGGDFNAPRAVVAQNLSEEFEVAEVAAGPSRTHSPNDDRHGRDLDHLCFRRGTITEVRVLLSSGLSDHRPVWASFQPGARGGD